MPIMTDRLRNEFEKWWNNPNAPMTEERELERADAVLEFFGFPDFIRKDEEKRIKARYAATRRATA